MVDDDVLLPDGGEAIAAMVADALGKARDEGLELEIGPLVENELLGIGIADQAAAGHDDIVRNIELVGDELAQRFRTGGINLHADHRAAAAALERAFEQADQVFGLFLDFDVAVADDAEQALPEHIVAGKHARNEQAKHLLERDEPGAGPLGRRQSDESFELLRDWQERIHRAAIAAAA